MLNPSSYPPERNLLFHNNGNGTFTEVARKAGVDDPTGRSLSAAWADFDYTWRSTGNGNNPRTNFIICVTSHHIGDDRGTSYGPYWDQRMEQLLGYVQRGCK